MKDLYSIWGRLAGRTYTAVNTNIVHNRDHSDDSTEHFGQKDIPQKRGPKRFAPKRLITIALAGLIGIASACFMLIMNPYESLFAWKVKFGEGGEIFELWRKPPVDIYLRVFLYNVTNSEAFLEGREKMKIEEVGPYVYKESFSHDNVTFYENGTIFTVPNHPLEWAPEMSEGHLEDDELILPNIALLSISHVVRDASYFTRLGLNLIIRQTQSQPLVRMTAKEFMFGYESKLLTLGNNFLPGWITFEKLGLIDRMYDFEGDYETVYTGETDPRTSGLLDTYRGSTVLPQWEGRHCANIQSASDGTKFPSFLQPNDQPLFYRKSLCRGSRLIRVNSTTRQSLEGWHYTFSPNAMDNGYFNEDNKCFCRNGNCLQYGLLDVTDCYYGFPIALSYPHFLHSDPELLNSVEGSKPDVNKHESYFIIQPKSGLPLDVAVRFQINMALGDVSHMAKVDKFANMVLPMLWMEIRMYSLPETLATRMRLYLNVLPTLTTAMMYFFFVFGTLFTLYALFKLYKLKMKLSRGNRIDTQWFDEDARMSKRRNSKNVHSKELEVYYNSLITPLDEDLSLQDFLDMKEEEV